MAQDKLSPTRGQHHDTCYKSRMQNCIFALRQAVR